jgi:Putative beta-barrel porin-2, OmpL-like. bbp2
MKFNKWTLGLAAVGVVSLTSAVRADETKVSELNTALSNTTISGYVDVAAQFNPGNGGPGSATNPNYNFGATDNSINLNVVDIAIDKPLDESPWASGYHVEFWVGPDGSSTGLAVGNDIRQAYIALRTPIGNGIDWKIGIWDTIIGYEGTTSSANPNYSRSFGYNIEPTTHTGIQGTYKVCDALTVTAGLADTSFAGGYIATPNTGLYFPTAMGLVTLTAPDNFGWAKGATFSGGVINTSGNFGATSWYAGFTLPTPVAALKFGGAFDYLNVRAGFNDYVFAGYGTYQFNDKLSLNLRAEYNDFPGADAAQEEFTATVQYNLWANVLTRLEVRWDHADHGLGNPYLSHGSTPTANKDAFLLAAQAIYTF